MKLPALLKQRGMTRILALDFETYYDDQYTLKKLTNTAYVRDPQFKAHGMSYRWNDSKTVRWVPAAKLASFIASVPWAETAVVAHNTNFDGFILTQQYKVFPGFYMDTLSMARAFLRIDDNSLNGVATYYGLGQKIERTLESTKGIRDLPPKLERGLGEYAIQDTRLLWSIFEHLYPEFPEDEMLLMHHTLKLYCEPVVQVNKKLAAEIANEERARQQKFLDDLQISAKHLRSRPKFAALLEELGVDPPMKVSYRTNEPTYAFAANDLEYQELMNFHPDERVRELCEARLAVTSTIKISKPERLIAHADPALPILLKYGAAHTLRWGGGDKLNAQNFPRKSRMRECLMAPKGHKFVIFDSSQIEARMLFWAAQQWDALEAFRSGKDLYCEFAGEYVYKRVVTKDDAAERFVGKVCVLGLGYMMQYIKLGRTLASGSMGMKVVLPEQLCKAGVNGYRTRFGKVPQLWASLKELMNVLGGRAAATEFRGSRFEQEALVLPNGMPLRYYDMRPKLLPPINKKEEPVVDGWTYDGGKKIYEGLLTENWIQALARLCVAQQILRVADLYKEVLMVHDEGVFCVPTKLAKRAFADIHDSFHTPPDWCKELPTAGEGVISAVYTKP